ncbi:MAG: hypothetical protein JW802_04365 [Campylobacterales bacterium]|nr:hypothetical protein [Campylobacterales bacterium]MBN2831882.1 hypothetical protein [Campylobacterales bacterium]
MRKFKMLFIAALATLAFVGCTAAPVQNINNTAVAMNSTNKATVQEVERAIIQAGGSLGWVMKKVNSGKIQGVLTLRKHVAVVLITYNANEYSITYQDSTALDYNPAENTIHKNYNGWIQNLNKAIQVQLSML